MSIRNDPKMNSVRMAKIREPLKRTAASRKLSSQQLHKLDKALATFRQRPPAPHILRAFDVHGTKVYVYTTMTLLVQGKNEEDVRAMVAEATGMNLTPARTIAASMHTHAGQVGADEVGVGDYFGPVVTAAVYLTDDMLRQMGSLGVKDSKLLQDKDVIKLAEQIGRTCPYSVQLAWPEQYNKMTASGLTAHHVKTYLHNKAINEVLSKIKVKGLKPLVVLDQFATEGNYARYTKDLAQEQAPIDVFATRAESKYPAVAAASIIARAAFLQAMGKLEKKYGMRLPLGATNVIPQARIFYQKFGRAGLQDATKVHFKTTEQVVA